MRKLIVSMNVTLDGYMAGPYSELDWHFGYWTPEMAEALCEQLSRVDTILLGRVTYIAMARYWPFKAADPAFPREDAAFADMMNTYPKIVFSKTLATADWNNSRLVKGSLAKEITKLKKQAGKDMILYGSGQVASAMIKLGLVDEYQLWVHPVVLGSGQPLFKKLRDKTNLVLVNAKAFSSGVVIIYYEASHAAALSI